MTYFNKRLFISLLIAFIVATVIGTLSHECGHYIVAEYLGYEARIHYSFTGIRKSIQHQVICSSDSFWITVGGPLQTLLTGTIGLVFLFLLRKSFAGAAKLTLMQWVLIFLSLFYALWLVFEV